MWRKKLLFEKNQISFPTNHRKVERLISIQSYYPNMLTKFCIIRYSPGDSAISFSGSPTALKLIEESRKPSSHLATVLQAWSIGKSPQLISSALLSLRYRK